MSVASLKTRYVTSVPDIIADSKTFVSSVPGNAGFVVSRSNLVSNEIKSCKTRLLPTFPTMFTIAVHRYAAPLKSDGLKRRFFSTFKTMPPPKKNNAE